MKNFVFFLLLFLAVVLTFQSLMKTEAFGHLLTQCDFGPRNPGSQGYYACLDFMVKEFEKYADEVILQEFSYKDPRIRKKTHELTNVIARFNPNAQFQTMISCHWDTRPVADMEDNREDRNQPIIGANDGASGVAVILELARILGENIPQIGVNLVMFDGEDMGIPGKMKHTARVLDILQNIHLYHYHTKQLIWIWLAINNCIFLLKSIH